MEIKATNGTKLTISGGMITSNGITNESGNLKIQATQNIIVNEPKWNEEKKYTKDEMISFGRYVRNYPGWNRLICNIFKDWEKYNESNI